MTKLPTPKPEETPTTPAPVVTPEARAEFLKTMGFHAGKAEDEEVVPKPGETRAEPAPVAPVAAATAQAPTPAPAATPPRGEGGKFVKVDPDAIKTAVRDGVREANATAPAVVPAPVVPEEENLDERVAKLEMEEDDIENLDALRWLQQNKPDEFKGRKIDEEFIKFKEAESAYIANWEKKHKGEEWDPTDESHAEFYAREPKIDQRLLANAKKQVVREQARRELMESPEMKEVRAEQVEIKRQQKLRDIEPQLQSVAVQAMIDFVEKADPEMGKLLKVGDKSVLNSETIEKMRVSNPEVFGYLSREAYVLKNIVAEIEKLGELGELYPPNESLQLMDADGQPVIRNGKPIHPHAEIVDFAMSMEDKFANAPDDKRKWEGKDFIRVNDLMTKRAAIFQSKMSVENKNQALADLSKKYWHVTTPMLKGMYVNQVARGVKKQLDWARKLHGGQNGHQATPPNGTPTPTVRAMSTPAPAQRPAPPSTSSSGDLTPTRIPVSAPGEDSAKTIQNALFPKS